MPRFRILQAVRIDTTLLCGDASLFTEFAKLRGLVTDHGVMRVANVELDATECVWSNGRVSSVPNSVLLPSTLCE